MPGPHLVVPNSVVFFYTSIKMCFCFYDFQERNKEDGINARLMKAAGSVKSKKHHFLWLFHAEYV